ncbi:hypothetical protein GZH53_07035 [Flavihumibacter sp. R14]|nr:hypothetical protein [Flavihumibacter soli]
MAKKNRYPGPLPFEYDDRELFFGRDQEIEYLTTVIINNKSTILHGKSGYGKTSLINAGIVPNLLENFHCEIIRIRFYNRDKKNPVKPRDTLINSIRQYSSGEPYLEKLINVPHISAWRYFKSMQYDITKRVPRTDQPEIGYILIFDQFEELFTYPKDDVKELGKELHELLLHRIPEEYQDCLKEGFRHKEQADFYKDELTILDKDIPLKILFSMRADRFNYLTHLVNYVPNLLANTIKIKRLNSQQVHEAIIEPALVENGFISPRFNYEDKLVNRILNFLKSDGDDADEEKIEIFEMQIICQKLEEIVSEYAELNKVAEEPFLLTEDLVLKNPAIKDKQAPFKEIIKNYYKESIESIKEPVERLSARYLIERKLIDPVTDNRISLDTALVSQTGISVETQGHLINKRIVRQEINTVSGKSLELSHDTLVVPIRHAAQELGDLNRKMTDFFNESLNSADKGQQSKIRNIIYSILLEERKPLNSALLNIDPATIRRLQANPLIHEGRSAEGIDNDIYRFSVKEAFQQTAQQAKISSQQSHTKDWVMKFTLVTLVFLVIIALLLFDRNQGIKASNKLRALVFLGYVDTIPNKEDALKLTKYIYDKKVLKGDDTSLIRVKFSKLLQTQDIQAKDSRYTFKIPTTNLKSEEIDFSETGDFLVVNNDSEAEKGRGVYKIIDKNGRQIKSFDRIMYAYFTNRPEVVLLARFPASFASDSLYFRINKASNEFILYNCLNGKADTVNMGEGRYLYPRTYRVDNSVNETNDSYRFRFTASGNLLIPFYQILPTDKYIQQVRVVGLNNNRFDRLSDGSISMNNTATKFMTVEIRGRNIFKVYSEDGQFIESISDIEFADFTKSGALVYSKGRQVSLRDASGRISNYNLPAVPEYVYADGNNKLIVADLKDRTFVINVASSATKLYEERLINLDFSKDELFTQLSRQATGGKESVDTLKRRSVWGGSFLAFEVSDGIQAVRYNPSTNETLLLTQSDRLILLDANFKIKAGFQLTPNDLFGFSGNGKRIYYVRNDFVSVFNNDNTLINFFDFEASLKWTNRLYNTQSKQNERLSQILRKKYDLNLQREFF